MAIITFSRQIVSLGDEIAAETAKRLGYNYVDKLVIEERLVEAGLVKAKIEKFDERKPGFWASLSQDRDDYFHWLKTALIKEAAKGDTVFAGRAAFKVFADVPGSLHFRVVAPDQVRIERAMRRFACDEENARKLVAKSDSDRAGFHRYFFNIEWNDAEYFHAVFNTGLLGEAEIVDAVLRLVEARKSPETEKAGRARIAERNLAQETCTEILYKKRIPVHFLDVDAEGKTVILSGVANSQAAIDAAILAAKVVPGVDEVRSAIQVIQDYTVMP